MLRSFSLLRSGHMFLNQRNIDQNMRKFQKGSCREEDLAEIRRRIFHPSLRVSQDSEREQLFSWDFSIVFEPLDIKSDRIKYLGGIFDLCFAQEFFQKLKCVFSHNSLSF
ncbi:hypothetical protein CEXT_659981 [Caerostris extrusa]|uniref:Ycf2 n=1 Tax=Caerostris extrusa TaxID=172846 RepID=A0AAV4MKF3_CAEEX|nr:hypothetical protein CEXT_659981 [Caerostris extrusa]